MGISNREVGRRFKTHTGSAIKGYGAMSVVCRGGLTIGFSYQEPVVIHNGQDTLTTIDKWSVTTAKHIGYFDGPGQRIPAITQTLRAVVEGRMSFHDAMIVGLEIQGRADEREMHRRAPKESMILKNGRKWDLWILSYGFIGSFKRLKDAKREAWNHVEEKAHGYARLEDV